MQKIPLGPVRAITFDMYGTLLDLEASFEPGFAEFLKAKGYPGSASQVVQAWEAVYLHESNVDSMLGRRRTPFEVVRRYTSASYFSSSRSNIPMMTSNSWLPPRRLRPSSLT